MRRLSEISQDYLPILNMKSLPLRIVLRLFTCAFYRATVLGPDNVPGKGGALLISNRFQPRRTIDRDGR